jgi:hypothetical protein
LNEESQGEEKDNARENEVQRASKA